MKKITLIDLIDKGKEYTLPNKTEITLGRGPESDIQIIISGESGVSKKHCNLYREKNKLSVIDYGSKNGTSINNQKLPKNKRYLLRNGDELRLCNYLLKVKISNKDIQGDLTEIEKQVGKEIKRSKSGDSDTAHDFAKEIDKL